MTWNYRIAANIDEDCYDVVEVFMTVRVRFKVGLKLM